MYLWNAQRFFDVKGLFSSWPYLIGFVGNEIQMLTNVSFLSFQFHFKDIGSVREKFLLKEAFCCAYFQY
jgi:hypothetical protein